jgi:hypothetical protein
MQTRSGKRKDSQETIHATLFSYFLFGSSDFLIMWLPNTQREKLVEEYFKLENIHPRMLYSIPDETINKFIILLKNKLEKRQFCCLLKNLKILMPTLPINHF